MTEPVLQGTNRSQRRIACRAFNQVEAVLLATILTCLISLLMPFLYRYVLQAQSTKCQANLRHLSEWLVVYSDTAGGWLPAYEDGWVRRLAEVGGVTVDPDHKPKGVFACPSQKFRSLRPDVESAAYWRGTTYGINQHITSSLRSEYNEPFSRWTQANINRFQDPSLKVIIADTSGSNYFNIPDRDPVIAGLSQDGLTYADALHPSPATPFPYLRHDNGSGNFLFIDGHIEQKRSWPTFMEGMNTSGYAFWHGEHLVVRRTRGKGR